LTKQHTVVGLAAVLVAGRLMGPGQNLPVSLLFNMYPDHIDD